MYKKNKKAETILFDFIVALFIFILLAIVYFVMLNSCTADPKDSPSNQEFLKYRGSLLLKEKIDFELRMKISDIVEHQFINLSDLEGTYYKTDIENSIEKDYNWIDSYIALSTLELDRYNNHPLKDYIQKKLTNYLKNYNHYFISLGMSQDFSGTRSVSQGITLIPYQSSHSKKYTIYPILFPYKTRVYVNREFVGIRDHIFRLSGEVGY